MYLRTNAEPARVAHVPDTYRHVVERVWARSGMPRTAGRGEAAHLPSRSEIHVRHDREHNAAQLHCKDAGSDMHEAVAVRLAALKADAVDCVYLDLPLADPDVYLHGAELDGLGFGFSCILPELRADGDVLRLQHLNGVALHVEEIATASDFGRDLLDEIVAGLSI
jgi:serine/threonine-protein kinase RsbW